MNLYEACIKRNIPTCYHESDLYIPVTPETTQLLKNHGLTGRIFIDQIDGGQWYDVAFQYQPFWDARKGPSINYGA